MTPSGGVSLDALNGAGLLALPDFLSPAVCGELRSAVVSSASVKATVARGGHDQVLDERTRRTRGATMPASLQQTVEEQLSGVRDRLAEHFGVVLGEFESPQFLAYGKGDFFRPHRDTSPDPTLAAFIRQRTISVVVFLCRQTRLPEPDSYCGGELIFFRLPGMAGTEALRAPVWGRPGLLVAFDSGQLHEVAPVTHGFRASVVSWFPAADE